MAITLLDKHNLLDKNVPYWECAVGDGALTKELRKLGYTVPKNTDLFDRGFGDSGVDFLKITDKFDGNILTNPPFNLLNEFIVHGLKLTDYKLYIFGRIQVLEGIWRWNNIFKNNKPSFICPFVRRIKCYPHSKELKGSAVCYAWFIWDNQDDNNECKVKWLI